MADTAGYRFLPTLAALLRDLAGFDRARCTRTFAAMLAGAVLEGVGLAMLVPLLALLAGDGGGTVQVATARAFAAVGVTGRVGRLALLLAAFVLLVLLRAVVLARRDRMMAELQMDYVEYRRTALLTALGDARWSDVAGLRHARVLHALDDNVERVTAAVQMLFQLAAAAAMLAVQWLLVLVIAPGMAAAALLLIALGGAALLPVIRRAGRTGHALAGGRLRLFDGAAQLLGGMKLAMAQNTQHAFIAEFKATAAQVMHQRLDHMRRFSRTRIHGTTIGALAGAVLVLAGVWYGTSVVALVAALAIVTRMIGPTTLIQQIAQQLTGHMPAHATLAALTAELSASGRPDTPALPVPVRAALRFEHVTYSHGGGDGGAAGVHDVSLTIMPGEIVGIVGASGAGKTSFADLVAGLLEPQRGTIRIGDVPLAPATARGWRDRIAYVGQDSYLFNDTIRRNLTLGLGDPPDAALWPALDMVGVGDLVRGLPDGLDTIVAERGARLSGGQRQRIALARALLRAPDLLLLDEATNAIDMAGESALFDRLVALAPRPTILVVAHRAETLARCERLLRFDAGRLVADGSGPAAVA